MHTNDDVESKLQLLRLTIAHRKRNDPKLKLETGQEN